MVLRTCVIFSQDVVHASTFQHRAGGTAGDHTGTGARRAQHHHTRGGLTLHRVGDGPADQRNAEETLASLLDTLGDGGRNFLGLAVADTDHAVAVAHHDKRGEAEPATALNHLGHAVDRNHALQVDILLLGLTAAAVVAALAPLAATLAAAPRSSWH
jgi:hypothetical protein